MAGFFRNLISRITGRAGKAPTPPATQSAGAKRRASTAPRSTATRSTAATRSAATRTTAATRSTAGTRSRTPSRAAGRPPAPERPPVRLRTRDTGLPYDVVYDRVPLPGSATPTPDRSGNLGSSLAGYKTGETFTPVSESEYDDSFERRRGGRLSRIGAASGSGSPARGGGA